MIIDTRDTREPLMERGLAECVDGIRTLYEQSCTVPDCLIGPFLTAMGILIWSYSNPADLWILHRAGELDATVRESAK